mmetsp:Transcript_38185/g.46589  ORF Transcript_38185/g.46589 Transcript_38185/m.46589 type:complete len:171 (-) Transcript_38185:94-606(-)
MIFSTITIKVACFFSILMLKTTIASERNLFVTEDELFWTRQLRGSIPPSCVCDVCPDGEACDDDTGSCLPKPYPNKPFRLGDSYTCTADDLSGCSDSSTVTTCYVPQCDVTDGICEYTNQVCEQDCIDPCEVSVVVSRCSCLCTPKICPRAGQVCDSSDGCCKDPDDVLV